MTETPNLLFIFTDEQRFDTIAANGGPLDAYPDGALAMPNLNRFAESACNIPETYCTQPVCTPSRGSILTGLYPHAHGAVNNNIHLDEAAACLPEIVNRSAPGRYRTAYHGKWHLGDEIFAQHGFDDWVSIEDHYRPWYRENRDKTGVSSYYQWLVANGFKPDMEREFSRGRATCLPREFTKPAFLAREACRFLTETRHQPFIHYINFLEPHMPFFGTQTNLYDPADVPLPPNYKDIPTQDLLKAHANHRRYKEKGFEWYDLSSEAGWRQMIAAYMGLNTLVDHYTGSILDHLESLGLSENTIVVFTSDHGEMMGSHRLLGKQVMYQESMRVPLLIRLPGQTAPMRLEGPVSQIDLVPTLLDLMGCHIPDGLHGRSRAGLLQPGKDARLDEDVVVCWNPFPEKLGKGGSPEELAFTEPTRTLVTADGWRYSHNPLSGAHELFNLGEDPLERRNLAADSTRRQRIGDFTTRLRAWQEAVGDTASAVG